MKHRHWALPIHHYAKSIRVTSDPETSWYGRYTEPSGYYDEWFWQLNASSFNVPQNIANADDPSQRAIAQLLSNLSATKVNTLVTAAEMHKTTDHIAKTATRLATAYRCIKKGDFTGLTSSLGLTATTRQRKRFNKRYNKAKSLDAQEHKYSESSLSVQRTQSNVSTFAGETWLEYSYGWKPLLYDVYGHAQALAELVIERQNVIRRVRGRAKTSSKKTKDLLTGALGFTGADHSVHLESEDFRWIEFGVEYKLQNGELNTFSQLGIDNPFEVLWEVVPFSFVADWFLPIGSFLKSLTATTGLTFHRGFKTERRFTDNKCTVTPTATVDRGSGRLSTYSGSKLIQSDQTFSMVRWPILEFPAPQVPDFRNPFGNGADYGLTKALSAVALLQSLFLNRAR
jgi:hypothetical protein